MRLEKGLAKYLHCETINDSRICYENTPHVIEFFGSCKPTCTNNYKRCGFSPHELTTHIPVLTTLSYCVQSRYVCVTGLFVMSELSVLCVAGRWGESKHKSGREGNSGTAAINRKEKIDYHRHPHSSSIVNEQSRQSTFNQS
jgi:hypothetical protein